MKNLIKRSITGIFVVAVILAGIIFHPYIFAFVFLIFLLIALYEFFRMSESLGFQPFKPAGLVAGAVLFMEFFLEANEIIPRSLAGMLMILPLFILVADLFSKNKSGFKNSMITIAGVMYVALPFSLLNYIVVPGSVISTGYYPWILVGIFLIIWMYDSMAYLFGSLLGKHKIYESISPKKSWEGFIGGAIFALIMAYLNSLFFTELNLLKWLGISVLVVIFGTCGDFFESKLKRECGIKDSGTLLPGHGGMLDRFDTVLFTTPVIYVWLNLFGNF